MKRVKKLINKGYMPGVIALAHAARKSPHIGILTARGGKKDHEFFLKRIEWITGASLNRDVCLFCSDDQHKWEKGFHTTAMQKLHFLLSIRNGWNGFKKFEKIKFFDDDYENVNCLHRRAEYIAYTGLVPDTHGIKIYNINYFDSDFLDLNSDRKKDDCLYLFDIDGTIIRNNIGVFGVIDSNGVLIEEHRNYSDIDHKKLRENNYQIDYSYFERPDNLRKTLHGNVFLKK